ncbi:MAG: hypothetical protein WB810_08830 [Candidatus Cybelea sp.]
MRIVNAAVELWRRQEDFYELDLALVSVRPSFTCSAAWPIGRFGLGDE